MRKSAARAHQAKIHRIKAAYHFAMSLVLHKGCQPKVGDIVRRKTDGTQFTVAKVVAGGIYFKEQSGLFNTGGFDVVTSTKHR